MGELLISLQVKDEMLQPTFNKSRLWNYSHLRCKDKNASDLSEMHQIFLMQMLRLKEMLRKRG